MHIIPNGVAAAQPDDYLVVVGLPETLPERCLVIETAPSELYWEEMSRRHFEVYQKGGQHLLLSLRHYEEEEKAPIAADMRRFESLTRGINSELLGRLSLLFGDEILAFNRQIEVDQFELYTLEALLEDYLHELSGGGFREALQRLEVKGEGFSFEKERLKIWTELEAKLKFQKEILGGILEVMESLSSSTPIHSLQSIAEALHLLIAADLPDRVKTRAWKLLWTHFQYQSLLIAKPGSPRDLLFRSLSS